MSVLAAAMAACWPVDAGLLLDVLDGSHDLAFFHLLTLLDVEVGDAAHGGGAEVDVELGLDLAGAADNGGEVLALRFWRSEPWCNRTAA